MGLPRRKKTSNHITKKKGVGNTKNTLQGKVMKLTWSKEITQG